MGIISENIQTALIVAVPAMLTPILMAIIANRSRRKEKIDDWKRQDEVAAKLLAHQELAATKAAEAAAISREVAVKIDGLLADRDKQNVREGEQKGRLAGEEAARQLAEGQRQGRESEREGVASAKVVMTPSADQPIPVADDRAGAVLESTAADTKRSADAQVKIADIAERAADKAEKKK